MDLDPSLVWPLAAVFLLSMVVTGPGMWSERWGWWWIRRRERPPGSVAPPAARRRDGR